MTESQARELCHNYAADARRAYLELTPANHAGGSWFIFIGYDTARCGYEWIATAETENELRLSIRLVERMTAIGYREGYAACERQRLAHQEQ